MREICPYDGEGCTHLDTVICGEGCHVRLDREKSMTKTDERPAERRQKIEKAVLAKVPVGRIFAKSGELCFADGIPKLVSVMKTEDLEELLAEQGEEVRR